MKLNTAINRIGVSSACHRMREMGIAMFCLTFFLFFSENIAHAQQEPQFTKYMFNTLAYNPGYAGSRGYMSIVALHRDQWLGWGNGAENDGRPVTQTFSIHSPVNKTVGLGLNLVNDEAGAHHSTFIDLSYAYRINFGQGTLSLGLQAGAMSYKADWSKLKFKDAQEIDNAFNQGNPSKVLPDFGAGLFFYTEKFYTGLSLPHLAQLNLREVSAAERVEIRKWARNYRHSYLTAGGVVPLNGETVVFRPSILIKTVGFFPEFFKKGNLVREIGSPTVFDVDASFLFSKKLWLGASFRSAFAAIVEQDGKTSSYDSVDFWAAFLMKNGFRIGFAYDYSLNEISNYSNGSIEIMLGYDFYREVEKINSPRYF
ncbi:MAG: type IX secretion system membrane protein PorP/SprF [Saprospiraceae bacterium]